MHKPLLNTHIHTLTRTHARTHVRTHARTHEHTYYTHIIHSAYSLRSVLTPYTPHSYTSNTHPIHVPYIPCTYHTHHARTMHVPCTLAATTFPYQQPQVFSASRKRRSLFNNNFSTSGSQPFSRSNTLHFYHQLLLLLYSSARVVEKGDTSPFHAQGAWVKLFNNCQFNFKTCATAQFRRQSLISVQHKRRIYLINYRLSCVFRAGTRPLFRKIRPSFLCTQASHCESLRVFVCKTRPGSLSEKREREVKRGQKVGGG